MLHKYKLLSLLALSLSILLYTPFSLASDTAKEKRWADQIVDSLLVGEANWLTVGKDKVLALYTEHTTEKAVGGAIVLHGIGAHPNWPDVVHPIRTQLPEYSWQTLSVQMPILPNEATSSDYASLYPEIAPRLDAAVAFFKSKGINNIVIVAHSLGSAMASHYLANKPSAGIRAMVLVGVSGRQFKEDKDNYLDTLSKISVPVLDIYGSNDLDEVLSTTKQKAQVAKKAGNKKYQQVEVPGANHFFAGKEEPLVKRVRGWLAKNAAGKEISSK